MGLKKKCFLLFLLDIDGMRKMEITKEHVVQVKKDFFEEITQILSIPPTEIDKIMEHDKFYFPPVLTNPKSYINDPDKGVLYFHFNLNFFNQKAVFAYSIFLTGDWIRIGILLFNQEIQTAHNADSQREIDFIWDRTPDLLWRGEGKMLIEWRFEEKDFYSNYAIRDRFILQMRHLHFRILRMLSDFCKRNKLNES